ncbi:MAG: MFS transporter [Hyphomonadaceae bacterium]|nr:MFS transporter [Hyphomonadaceae bacterium]
MTTTGTANAASAASQPLTKSYVNYALAMLLVVYTLNFVDRQIVAILGEDIKAALDLDDTQFGLLGGLAFALFYTVLGIPIARLAERGNRVRIISIALAVWSGFTALCGVATSFVQILLFRIGVGVGEAGCTPPAHSLISDYVPPEKRASALALYSMGVPIGTFAGFALGAVIAENFGWRAAFFAVGIPGVLLAFVTWFTLKEPRVLGLVQQSGGHGANFGDALKELSRKPSYWYAVLAATVISFIGYGHAYFLPAYLARTHEMGLQERGLGMAVMVLIAGVLGTWAGGRMADRASQRDTRAYMTLPAIAFVLGAPFFVAGMLVPAGDHVLLGMTLSSGYVALLFLAIPTALNSIWYGPIYASIQGLARPHTRATAVAVMFFILNLVGLGLGPTIVGVLSDMFAAQHYGAADAAAFKAVCPPRSPDALCLAAQAEGLKLSLLWSATVGVLALVFFVLGRRTIREDLEATARGA